MAETLVNLADPMVGRGGPRAEIRFAKVLIGELFIEGQQSAEQVGVGLAKNRFEAGSVLGVVFQLERLRDAANGDVVNNAFKGFDRQVQVVFRTGCDFRASLLACSAPASRGPDMEIADDGNHGGRDQRAIAMPLERAIAGLRRHQPPQPFHRARGAGRGDRPIVGESAEVGPEFGRRLVPVRRPGGAGLEDDRLQIAGNRRIAASRPGEQALRLLVDQPALPGFAERRLEGQQFVEGQPQAVDVAAVVRRAVELLSAM